MKSLFSSTLSLSLNVAWTPEGSMVALDAREPVAILEILSRPAQPESFLRATYSE
jgi:hypothetical protein